MATYDLAGKVAFVTGGARGIGLETARLLLARGASVALVDLDHDDTVAAAKQLGAGDRVLPLTADVTDRDALDDAVAQAVERLGGIDVVVANAGIAPPPSPVTTIDVDAFEQVIEVNLLGVWRTVRATLPQVIQRRGHVVVVASIYAFTNGVLTSPYAMSKAGVEQLGRALRVELASHGASAGVAEFGFIDTTMVRDAFVSPIAQRLEDRLPAFMTRRLTPAQAAEAMVHGIEKRASRTLVPAWWRPLGVLRGIVNPLLDAALRNDSALQALIRDAESADRAARGERTVR
jgi:NAD(P)-dependent dehydrogenase (short-subunit alcohol dehydrogenase family)